MTTSATATRRTGTDMDLHSLYEELIHLDEIAGELDPETNARIDRRRVALKQQILDLENNPSVDRVIQTSI